MAARAMEVLSLKLQICGRVQSREYTKKVDEESVEKRVAYEVSVSKIDLVEEE